MPIDINALRPERGGDPEKWREYCRKRFKSPELVDNVVELDKVSGWANEYKREPGNLNFFFSSAEPCPYVYRRKYYTYRFCIILSLPYILCFLIIAMA
jgi:hypothetical protein